MATKTIRLKQLTLLNFKGVRDLDVYFDDHTLISGRNASGKSTIYDAFIWVLFGKNVAGEKQFGIKTLNGNGEVIPRLPHEVTAVLDIDGEEITITRSYTEKWTKKRGTAVEEMTGHEEKMLFNNVPLSKTEYAKRINSICAEDIFRYITNYAHFISRKKEEQRAMLVQMAGEVNDESIAMEDERFIALLNALKGKTLEEYKRELTAKKTRIKKEVDELPARIDERRRDLNNATEEWDTIEVEIEAKQKQLAEIEQQIADEYKRDEAKVNERLALANELTKLQRDYRQRAEAITLSVQSKHFELLRDKQKQESLIKNCQDIINISNNRIAHYSSQLEKTKATREALLTEYRAINAETLTFNDADFVCPVCHRQFEVDDIEAKQRELTEQWMQRKEKMLLDNVARGKAVKAQLENITTLLKQTEDELRDATNQLSELQQSEILRYNKTIPDATPTVESDLEIIRIDKEIKEVQGKITQVEHENDTSVQKRLLSDKAQLTDEINALQKRLYQREANKKIENRIAELEAQLKAAAQELATVEREEQTVFDFMKSKMTAVTNKVNDLFKYVKFRLYEMQINGGEREVCEILIDGVPYSDANNAARINAGLDIVQTISRHLGISAPIFVDNTEAVNNLTKTTSQQIELKVTTEPLQISKL